jgi:hypothetical protein
MEQGKYNAKAETLALGFASTGTPQIGISFAVAVGGEVEYVTWYGYFTDAAADRTIKALRDMGWTGNDLDQLKEDCSDLPNAVQLDIQPDDKGYMKVAWINKPGGGVAMRETMTQAQKLGFAQQMKGRCLAIKADTPIKKKDAPASKWAEVKARAIAPEPVQAQAPRSRFINDFPEGSATLEENTGTIDDDSIPF